MAKKKVLSLWKAIIIVISAIVGLLGAAALVLYLTGQLDEKHVEPNHMEFSTETTGEAFFDGQTTIAGINGQVSVFKTSTNFQMTILSNTEGLTETEVTLSLSNQISSKNGALRNGVIAVPEKVELNKPFSVELVTSSNAQLTAAGVESWIRGGTTLITAESSKNILLDPIYAQVKVDVPVYDFEATVAGQDFGQEVNSVFVGTAFALEERFLPNESQMLFSQEGTSKQVFYSSTKAFIDYDWTLNKFIAKEKSGVDTDTITAYTFKNSYYQQKVLSQFSSELSYQDLTARILEYANERDNAGELKHEHEFITTEVKIKVTDVEVGSIYFKDFATEFNLSPYCNKYFTITTNSSTNGDESLEADIKDEGGAKVNSALANLALRFPDLDEDDIKNFKMSGGDVIKVVKKPKAGEDGKFELVITRETFKQENYEKYFSSVEVGGDNAGCAVKYYLLPNTTPANPGNYYWQFACGSELAGDKIEMDVNFFFENQFGFLENFFDIEDFSQSSANKEESFEISPREKTYEENPSWVNDTIYMSINFDSNGVPIPDEVDLSKDLNPINGDNIYKTVKYFLFVDKSASEVTAEEDAAILAAFKVKNGLDYDVNYLGQDLSIDGAKSNKKEGQTDFAGFRLYEFDGISDGVLTVEQSFNTEVSVFVATVQTDVEKKTLTDEQGRYKIVNTSRVRTVIIESSLSIANMNPTFAIEAVEPDADRENNYYIPAINRDMGDSQKAIASIRIELTGENQNAGKETDKLLVAFKMDKLRVVCVDADGDDISQYVTLQSLEYVEADGSYQGKLMVEEQLFRANAAYLDKGVNVFLQLEYDDGNMVHPKAISNGVEGAKNNFFIYNQQPNELVWDTAADQETLKTTPIEVELSTDEDEGLSVSWGASVNDLGGLNSALTFKIKDQFGKEIFSNLGLYRVKFVEIVPAAQTNLIAFDSLQQRIAGFNSTNGLEKQTQMQVYIVDAEDKFVYKYDPVTGLVTDQLQASDVFNFSVRSEGVSHVFYYNKNIMPETVPDFETPDFSGEDGALVDDAEDDYTLGQTGNATISVYAVPGKTLSLGQMLKVFVNEKAYGNLKFYFDSSYVAGLGETRQKDMLKMLTINDGTLTDGSLVDLVGQEISTLKVEKPFKEDVQIKFIAKDENGLLFEIELNVVLKSDLRIDNSINLYNEKYADYLVSKDETIGVFADEHYSLEEFFVLTPIASTNAYAWKTALNDSSINQNISNYISGAESDVLFEEVDGKLCLYIKPVYKFKEITFTLYYGAASVYTCSVTVSLYLNPNVVMEENVVSSDGSQIDSIPYINLADATTQTFATHYNFYKFTGVNGYYDCCLDGSAATLKNVNHKYTITNNSDTAYVEWADNADKSGYLFKFVQIEQEVKTLMLKLGEKQYQKFKLTQDGEDVSFIKIRKYGKPSDLKFMIGLCGVDSLPLEFNMGYGEQDSQSLAANIISRWDDDVSGEGNGEIDENETFSVPTVEYKGDSYVVLIASKKYVIQNNFTLTESSSAISGGTTQFQVNSSIPLVSYVGNYFNVSCDISANTTKLNVQISIGAIVTRAGEKLVYYNPFTMGANGEKDETITKVEEKKFNNYGDVELQDLIGDYLSSGEKAYKSLEENNVYQTLKAGASHKIVHPYDINETLYNGEEVDTDKDGEVDSIVVDKNYGFYLLANLNVDEAYSKKLTIVESAEGYIAGLAEIDGDYLKIKHLESELKNAYIVLRFEIVEYSNPNNAMVWFYRVKVEPSFEMDESLYPYASDAEYLDSYSKYYIYNETEQKYYYEIDLEEPLNLQNSRHEEGYRFSRCKTIEEIEIDAFQYQYAVSKVFVNGIRLLTSEYATYFEYEHKSESQELTNKNFKIHLKDPATIMTVYISRKVLTASGELMIGSESEYVLKFNQGETYVVSISRSPNPEDESVLDLQGNKFFVTSVKASDEATTYTIAIQKTQSGVTTDVENLTAKFLNDKEELANGLMCKVTAYAGAQLYSDDQGTIATEDGGENKILTDEVSFWADFGTYVQVASEGYYISVADEKVKVDFAQWQKDGNKFKFTIKPKASIKEDQNFDVEFYTDQKTAFYLDLSVASYFSTTQGITEVLGGREYNLMTSFKSVDGKTVVDIQGIFDEIKTTIEGENIEKVIISLAESSEAHADLVFINNATPWNHSTITFANLKTDTKFDFVAEIKDDKGTYSFNFSLFVKASFEEKARVYTDKENRYGSVGFNIDEDSVIAYFADLKEGLSDKTSYTISAVTVQSDDVVNGTTITPQNVISSTTRTAILTIACEFIACEFKYKKIFDFEVTYSYTVMKNVSLGVNYPIADGKTISAAEYIGTTKPEGAAYYSSQKFEGFFNTAALGRKADEGEKRIDIKDETTETITHQWQISIAAISNVKLVVTAPTVAEYETVGDVIFDENSGDISSLNFSFELISDSINGRVVFTVVVNKVPISYEVIVVAGNVYTVTTNAPNYANNQETIYAEDYNLLESKNLFEDGRILSYTLSSSASSSSAYYARFESAAGDDFKVFELSTNKRGSQTNIDLGFSGLSGWKYVATYKDKPAADVADSKFVYSDDVFTMLPKLTGRIEASYYDGTILKLDDDLEDNNTYVKLGDGASDKKASEVTLNADENYGKKTTYGITLVVDGEEYETNYNYSVFLDVKFEVTGSVESATSYKTIELEADPKNPKSLLSLAATHGIKIMNPETQTVYTTDALYDLAGQISLKLYGFADLPIVSGGDDLQNIAYSIDNALRNSSDNGIIYSTGLNPRAGFTLNGDGAGSSTNKNYLFLTGLRADTNNANSKIVDYNLFAQGANNDGNHVMTRLTYSVDVGGSLIEKHYNILFKILPNSTIEFRNKINETGFTTAGSEVENKWKFGDKEEEDGKFTIASNHEKPFEIDTSLADVKNNSTINMRTEDKEGESDSNSTLTSAIVNAYMYGDHSTNYNSQFAYNISSVSTDTGLTQNKESENDERDYIYTYTPISLGEKNYAIDMENAFGYKARLYIRVFSEINPTIVSGATTLKEGETFVFASQYQDVDVTKNEANQDVIKFDYSSDKGIITGIEFSGIKQIKIEVLLSEQTDFVYKGADYSDPIGGDGDTADKITKMHLGIIGSSNDDGVLAKGDSILSGAYVIGKNGVKKGSVTDVGQLSFAEGKEVKIGFSGDFPSLTYDNVHVKDSQDRLFEFGFANTENGFGEMNYRALKTSGAIENATYNITIIESSDSYSFDVKYESNGKESAVAYGPKMSINPQINSPTTNIGANKHFVFGGISAFAFDGGVSGKAIDDPTLHSYVTDIKVTEVKFEVDGREFNASKKESSYGGRLITHNGSENYDQMFIAKSNKEVVAGTKYGIEVEGEDGKMTIDTTKGDPKVDLTVPYFDGILYGTVGIINDVKMIVTLEMATGNDSETVKCEVVKYITIEREAESGLFASTTIADGGVIQTSFDSTKISAVYNDTLEVYLAPGANIKLAVSKSNDFSNQTYVTLTNNNEYDVIKYVSISQNIAGLTGDIAADVQNLTPDSKFYVNVIDEKAAKVNGIMTAGSTFEVHYNAKGAIINVTAGGQITEEGITRTQAIGVYDSDGPTALHIHHVNELNSSNTKTERLYFLFKTAKWTDDGNKPGHNVYQHSQNFTVTTLYTRAQHSSSPTNAFDVESYGELVNSDASEIQYVISANEWGASIDLYSVGSDGKEADSGKGISTEAKYKFYYQVDSTGLGGSAVVDENGLIITDKVFNILEQKIFLNVYMKVSGANGMFEENNTKLRIGQLQIGLIKKGNDYKETLVPNGNNKAGAVYKVNGEDIVVVPAGYKFNYIKNSDTKVTDQELGDDNSGTFAYELGKVLTRNDFEKMLGSAKVGQGTYNRNYHVVREDDSAYLHYNNCNNYVLSKAGTHTIDVVATHVGTDETRTLKSFKLTLVVYDTSVTETLTGCLNSGETYEFDSSWTWYQIDKNGVRSLVDDTRDEPFMDPDKDISNYHGGGVYNITYIAEKGLNSKFVEATFYVYDSTETRNIAVTQGSTYRLVNMLTTADAELKNKTYFAIRSGKLVETSYQDIGSDLTKGEYLVVGDNGDEKAVKKYDVAYTLVPTTVYNKTLVVEKGKDATESIEEVIAQDRGIDLSSDDVTMDLYTMDGNGLLTGAKEIVDGVEVDSYDNKGELEGLSKVIINDNNKEIKFVAKVNDHETVSYYRYTINFFAYTEIGDGGINVVIPQSDAQFKLSSCNAAVQEYVNHYIKLLTGFGDTFEVDVSQVVSYYIFDGTSMISTPIISVEGDRSEGKYYIKVGVKGRRTVDGEEKTVTEELWMYIDLKLHVYSGRETAVAFDSYASDLVAEVVSKVNDKIVESQNAGGETFTLEGKELTYYYLTQNNLVAKIGKYKDGVLTKEENVENWLNLENVPFKFFVRMAQGTAKADFIFSAQINVEELVIAAPAQTSDVKTLIETAAKEKILTLANVADGDKATYFDDKTLSFKVVSNGNEVALESVAFSATNQPWQVVVDVSGVRYYFAVKIDEAALTDAANLKVTNDTATNEEIFAHVRKRYDISEDEMVKINEAVTDLLVDESYSVSVGMRLVLNVEISTKAEDGTPTSTKIENVVVYCVKDAQ